MKAMKKALSCVLAVIMIMSSMSVSFTVFAATTKTDDIYSAIDMHYDGLMAAIEDAGTKVDGVYTGDASGIPVSDGSTWTVEKDTFTGGWTAVASAYAEYAKGTWATNKTYRALVNAILAEVDTKGSAEIPKADYATILEFFAFGTTDPDKFISRTDVTLKIGSGFDLFAFKDVASIDTSREYANSTLYMTPNGTADGGGYVFAGKENISFTKEATNNPGTVEALEAIKTVLEDCVKEDTFKAWLSKDSLTSEELEAFAMLYSSYTTTLELAGYYPEEVWDHFVRDVVGKTYAEADAFYENSGAREAAAPFAADFITRLDALMAADLTGKTVEERVAHLLEIDAVINEINANSYSALIISIMNETKGNYIGKKGYTVESYIEAQGLEIAKLAAADIADRLVASAAASDTLAINADSETWETTDKALAQAWYNEASAVTSYISTYILAYATLDDVKDVFSANGKSVTKA